MSPSVNIQSDGKIVVAGYTRRTDYDIALVRLLSPPKCAVPNVRGRRPGPRRERRLRGEAAPVGRVKRKASTRVKRGTSDLPESPSGDASPESLQGESPSSAAVARSCCLGQV